MTVGGFIAIVCGLCTGTIGSITLLSGLMQAFNGSGNFSFVVIFVFVTGVLPTAVGVVLFLTGRKLHNPAAAPLFKRRAQPQDRA